MGFELLSIRMAYTVEASFSDFYERINLPGDHRETANARRDRIVDLLKNDFQILEAFGTGSIPKFTALKGRADLDLMVVLHFGKHVRDKAPSIVLQDVRDSLSAYPTDVRKNGQAVTLYYDTWPNVDIRPCESKCEC
jgi:Second Messenger Oligonucleotide or Dinucleotide Synthetase domain